MLYTYTPSEDNVICLF